MSLLLKDIEKISTSEHFSAVLSTNPEYTVSYTKMSKNKSVQYFIRSIKNHKSGKSLPKTDLMYESVLLDLKK